MAKLDVKVPEKLRFFGTKRARYKVTYGGRGSAKSWNIARQLLGLAATCKLRILCAREFQNSIADSVHKLLADQIRELGLAGFVVQKTNIINVLTGSEFLFAGLHHNIDSIKSMEGIDICWVEEAERVSERSWSVLIPTIRKPNSEIWISFNPAQETDPTYQRFVVNPPPDCLSAKMSWHDNPWLPQVLRDEAEHLRKTDPEAYMHVWEGETWSRSDAQILCGKWTIEDFAPKNGWQGPYLGADWGFAQDPTCLLRVWIDVPGKRLCVEHEAVAIGCDIDKTPALFDTVPDSRRHVIRADCARPETISYMKRAGFRIEGCPKWAGSVEDGIAHLRSYDKVIVHPRCRNFIQECRLYSYKVDKLTGEIRPDIVDKHNHGMDACRYALNPLIQKRQQFRGSVEDSSAYG